MKFKDYYQILQVDPNATLEEIKQAYHRLAHKYHPDISKEADAERRFKEIKSAYEVLKDPQKRANYTTRLKIILPYSYEWFIGKRNTWLNYFAQQQAKKDARTRVKLQWQSWKPRPPTRVQPTITNPAAINKNPPQLTRFFKRFGIAILLMLVGIAGYLGLKQIQTWHNHRQWQAAILQQDKVAIRTLEQADPETQRQVLQDNPVKTALVTFYLQQNGTPILTQLATYDATIQADIFKNDTIYQLLTDYYSQQINTELATDNFSTALQQLETLLNHYPASLELKNKYEAIQQQKQQRLAQLTQQYMECLDQILAPLLERTHCMVEARRKIEQVGIEHHLPNDPNLSAMYTEEIQHALAESTYDKAEKLLLDWEKLLPEPNEERQMLWKNLALHRQFNDITADLNSHDSNKIVSRLSQLTTDNGLQQKVTQIPQIQKI
ncbi:MAG: J domain-containing protein [Thioploca sp.]|nr:J domain-containing protein [Thioploca sp.]